MLKKLTILSALAAVGFGALLAVNADVTTDLSYHPPQPTTNAAAVPVQWVGSVVVEHWNKTGSNSWESAGGAVFGKTSDPSVEIGLRADGVVVWRKK